MGSPFYTAEHEVVRRFVEKEIAPLAHEWDEAGGFRGSSTKKAAAIGLRGLRFPEEYGGTQVDNFIAGCEPKQVASHGLSRHLDN
jgi:acyl-CoA dehydrogenase